MSLTAPARPYGRCAMVNLCKGDHCVHEALERDGWIPDGDGGIKKKEDQQSALKGDYVLDVPDFGLSFFREVPEPANGSSANSQAVKFCFALVANRDN